MWSADGPTNDDRNIEQWPRPQTLLPGLCGFNGFIADISICRDRADRIGARPLPHPVPREKALDVGGKKDFLLAAELWELRHHG